MGQPLVRFPSSCCKAGCVALVVLERPFVVILILCSLGPVLVWRPETEVRGYPIHFKTETLFMVPLESNSHLITTIRGSSKLKKFLLSQLTAGHLR